MSSKDYIFIQDPNGTQLKMNELFKVDNDQSKLAPVDNGVDKGIESDEIPF